jgi:fatty-acyl-CoA synthase
MTGNNLSYVHGTSLEPLLGETVGCNFDRMAERHAEREALIVPHQNVRWSYAELKRRVDRLAGGLLSLGLEPGDRVGVWSPNNWQWVVTQFATAKAGLILVNVNPAYRLGELDYALKKVGCSALITASAFKSSNYIKMLDELIPELATAGDGPLNIETYPELRWLIRIDDERSHGMLNARR